VRAASAPGAIEADARANSARQLAGASIAPAASTPAQVAAGHLNALLDRSEPGRLLSTTAEHWGKRAPAPRAAAHALRRPPHSLPASKGPQDVPAVAGRCSSTRFASQGRRCASQERGSPGLRARLPARRARPRPADPGHALRAGAPLAAESSRHPLPTLLSPFADTEQQNTDVEAMPPPPPPGASARDHVRAPARGPGRRARPAWVRSGLGLHGWHRRGLRCMRALAFGSLRARHVRATDSRRHQLVTARRSACQSLVHLCRPSARPHAGTARPARRRWRRGRASARATSASGRRCRRGCPRCWGSRWTRASSRAASRRCSTARCPTAAR